MTQQFPAIIVVFPVILSFIIYVVGWWSKRLCFPLAILALSVCVISSIGILNTVLKHGTIHYWLGGWEPPWGIEYLVDHLNAFMLVIVSFVSLVVAIYSKRSVEQELPEKIPQFWTVFVLLITGLLGITITGDMFNLFVLLEIASLAAYALIAMGEKGAVFASFRYVILGAIGACWYLLGTGYLYIVTGSLNMMDLSQLLPNLYQSKAVLVGFVFILVGVAIKMALFPLHAWLPDAYTHAPSAVSALVAALMTKVGAYVMVRIMFTVFKPHFSIELIPITTILSWMGAVAMIMGSIFAIMQSDLKRMLAYSSVAQIGYIVLGVGLANRMGLTGGLLHILNHAFMKGCLFLVAGAIVYKMGMRDIYQFKDLYRKMPYTMAAFTIAAFSMIGIPPTCGFFSKLYLILGSIDAKQWVFVGFILLSSMLNVVYFINVIRHAYFEPPKPDYAHNGGTREGVVMDEVPLSMLIPILVMASGILLLGIFNGKIISTVLQFAIPASF